MEAYKTACTEPNCGYVRYWVGYKTGLGKSPEQLAQMEREQITCMKCGAKTAKTELDRESQTGQIFSAQTKLLVDTLSDLMKEQS
ncbi:MAG: hypothetical protein ABIB55_02235 [Candidatus Nealsonbacteria bacterium]